MAFPSDQTVEKNNQNYSSFSNASSVGDDVELVYIQDNEMVLVPDDKRPKGSFYVLPMRTMSDKMYYGTGVAYLTGLAYGGIYGTIRGLQKAPVNKLKVQWSSIINQTTRYGPWAANSLGVMTFAWAVLDSMYANIREKDDYVNHIGAAFTSGMLFKCTAGLRPAILTGGILSAAVATYGGLTGAFTKKSFFNRQGNTMQL